MDSSSQSSLFGKGFICFFFYEGGVEWVWDDYFVGGNEMAAANKRTVD